MISQKKSIINNIHKKNIDIVKKTLPGLLASAILLGSPSSKADKPPAYISSVSPETRLAVYGTNLGINAAVCGITAALEGRNVVKDIANCVLGSSFQSVGMEFASHDNSVTPSIGLHLVETGTSVINNTITGREPFQKLYYGLGPGLLELDTKEWDYKIHWRILPSIGLLTNTIQLNSFDIENSLRYNSFVFRTEHGFEQTGFALGNIITVKKNAEDYVLSHEFNHQLQYVRLRPAQEFIGSDWLDEKIKLRIGEDLGTGIFHSPTIFCRIIGGKKDGFCSRRYWNLLETESYIMESANETFDERL